MIIKFGILTLLTTMSISLVQAQEIKVPGLEGHQASVTEGGGNVGHTEIPITVDTDHCSEYRCLTNTHYTVSREQYMNGNFWVALELLLYSAQTGIRTKTQDIPTLNYADLVVMLGDRLKAEGLDIDRIYRLISLTYENLLSSNPQDISPAAILAHFKETFAIKSQIGAHARYSERVYLIGLAAVAEKIETMGIHSPKLVQILQMTQDALAGAVQGTNLPQVINDTYTLTTQLQGELQ